VSQEKEVYGVDILGLNVPDEVLSEVVDYTPYPLRTIDNFKLVSRSFYAFFYRNFFNFFSVKDQMINQLGFKKGAQTEIDKYFLSDLSLSLKEILEIKKMFSIFFNTEYEINETIIKELKFKVYPIANDFRRAMLKYLKNDHEADCLLKNIIKELNQQIENFKSPIAKEILSIFYQNGFGVEQDEAEARKLEKDIISCLSNSNEIILPWNFQIRIFPIFIEWFQNLELLTQLQLVQNYLKSFSYVQIEFVNEWVHIFLEEINEFIFPKTRYPHLHFQVGEGYLNLLNLLKQLPLDHLIEDFLIMLKFTRKWLKEHSFDFFKLELGDDEKVNLFLEKIKIYFKLLELFKNNDNVGFLDKKDSIEFLSKIGEIFLNKFKNFFHLKDEHFFIGKFKAAQLFSNLSKNSVAIEELWEFKKIIKDWLELKKDEMKKALTQDFYNQWKDYCSLAVYCIQEKQGLEKMGMNCIQAFFSLEAEVDIFLQTEIAAYLIEESKNSQVFQCIKNWLKLEKTQVHLKEWLNQLEQYEERASLSVEESRQFIAQVKWFIKLRYFMQMSQFFEEDLEELDSKKVLLQIFKKDLEKLSSQRVLLRLQLAGFCFHLKNRKARQFVINWLNSEKVQSALRTITPKDYVQMQENGKEVMEVLYFHFL